MIDWDATEKMLRGMYQELVKTNFWLALICVLLVILIIVTFIKKVK